MILPVSVASHVSASSSSQINKETGMMEASRIMNLYQFIQLYHDITSQAAEVLSAEGASRDPSVQLSSTDSCQASMWMGRYTHTWAHATFVGLSKVVNGIRIL